jgi:hypothetical protein
MGTKTSWQIVGKGDGTIITADDIAIAWNIATQDNLHIRFCNGDGSFRENPVSNQDELILLAQSQISCYPNPCKDFVNFNTDHLVRGARYTIYNTKGQAIRSFAPDDEEFVWDLKDSTGLRVSSGIYLIKSGQDNKATKFIVLR